MVASLPAKAVGIPWYRRDDYERVLGIMEDSATLPRTFDAWEGSAERMFEICRKAGAHPFRAELDPATFVAWCDEHAVRRNAAARTEFAEAAAQLQSEFEREES